MMPDEPTLGAEPARMDVAAPGLVPKLQGVVNDLIPEAFAVFLLLLIIAGAEKWLHWLIGDYKFFDYLPVRWVFDFGHLTIITLFIWRNVRKFRD